VSPEILAFSAVRSEPVLVRGVDLEPFLDIEGASPIPGGSGPAGWALAGASLARRLGLAPGTDVALVGSTVPRLEVVRITGLFDAAGPTADELLVPLDLARSLTGVGTGSFHSIRVRTQDSGTLLAFLASYGASVHVTGPGLPRADVNSDPPADDRLTNLLLRSGRGAIPRDYMTTGVAEATNSVRVVALGLGVFLGILVASGVHAVQARAFADRRRSVGILRAVGASGAWVRLRGLRETVPLALLAGAAGAGIGVAADRLLRPATSLVLFGHEIQGTADPWTLLAVVAALVAASAVSQLLLVGSALRERPTDALTDRAAAVEPRSLEVVLRG